MLTLISTALSFLMGGLPKILDFFQDRSDKSHELNLAKMQTERELALQAAGFQAQQRIEEINYQELQVQTASDEKIALIGAQQAEMQAIYQHDIEIGKGAAPWVLTLRASVRPVVTYCFVGLLLFVDIAGLAWAWKSGFVTDLASFRGAMDSIFDDNEMTILSSIIAFHFGGRAFGK